MDLSALFTKVRKGKGAPQYDLELVKMLVEMIAIGAVLSVINKILLIFAQLVNPDMVVEKLPHKTYLQQLGHILTCISEDLSVL